jgi:hypothetical protein
VVRGEEEARARRWAAGTPAAAIKAGGSVRGRFRERKGGAAWGGDGWVLRALEGMGGSAGRRGGAGQLRPARPGRWGGRLRVEDGPDR